MVFSATRIRTRRAAAALIGAGLALGPVACSGPADDAADAAIAVTDGSGRPVTLAAPARRVISMMPATTEWTIAFGAADRLVARTDYDDHPAVAHLPTVGGGLTPSVEWIAAREPDLVIAWPDAPSRSLVSRLEALGIAVYEAPSETISQALDVAADLGALLGLEAVADTAITRVRAGLDSVRAAVAGLERPAVLFLIGLDPIIGAGPGTFLDELVTIAGGRNVLAATGLIWPQLSLEEIVARAPEIVIIGSASLLATSDGAATRGATGSADLLRGRPGWRDVPAVRTGSVYAVDPNDVNRPGPDLHESAALLARLIHEERP